MASKSTTEALGNFVPATAKGRRVAVQYERNTYYKDKPSWTVVDIADAREDRILVKHPQFENTHSLRETWVVIYRSTETHWLGYDLDTGFTWEIMAPDGLVTISGKVDMNKLRPPTKRHQYHHG